MAHTLPPLSYPYEGLEPFISREIMTLHHTKHHQTYVNALNAAELAYAKAQTPKERIALQAALKFNGGGHINHSLFWKNLAPSSKESKGHGGDLKSGALKDAIVQKWGSVDIFIKEFNTATAGIQGSGWGWLGYSYANKSLEVVTTANQDPLITHTPIIGVDIWEHAFYLQYKNVKVDYLNAIWNVIDWNEADRRYTEALSSSKL